MLRGFSLRYFVAGIRVPKKSHRRIVIKYTFQALIGFRSSVADYHYSGMDRIADSNAAAMMQRHPRCTANRVECKVQDGPVCDRIGSVLHRFRLAVRACDRAAIEVVPAN